MKTFALQVLVASLLSTIAFSNSMLAQAKDTLDIGNEFIPAGYMGCVNNINIDPAWSTNPKTGPLCFKVSYMTTCSNRWAGVYWTNVADDSGANWGQSTGRDLTGKKYAKINFWARGEKGGEVVEFGAFGIDSGKTYKDGCQKVTVPGRVNVLTTEWKLYSIKIPCETLKSVIGGFYWSASWNSNPSGLVFYLDDIFIIEE